MLITDVLFPSQKFQDVEEAHLIQMKEFLYTYAELLQQNHELIGQVSTASQGYFYVLTHSVYHKSHCNLSLKQSYMCNLTITPCFLFRYI